MGAEAVVWGFETDTYKPRNLKWKIDSDLQYSTGNSAQYYVTT